jgi:hypothetical protein
LLLIAGAARLLRMGFFDGVSRVTPGKPYPKGDPWDPPSVEFPRVAASAVLLARTEVVAVAITAIWAFTAGFEFWVGIPESRAEVDARLVLDAAKHSVQIWPAGNSSSG